MDPTPFSFKLHEVLKEFIQEVRPFGNSQSLCVEIDLNSILEVAHILHAGEGLGLDWLENLTVAEIGTQVVFTYFLKSFRSYDRPHELILQASVSTADLEKQVIPSVSSVWKMAAPMEQEAAEMFGVRFRDEEGSERRTGSRVLPAGWEGFPLRKNYQFPKMFHGIAHARPDEHETIHGEEGSRPCQ